MKEAGLGQGKSLLKGRHNSYAHPVGRRTEKGRVWGSCSPVTEERGRGEAGLVSAIQVSGALWVRGLSF